MKCNNKKLAARILLMLALGLYHAMPVAYALPSQGTLDNTKAATITTSGNIMNIAGKGKNNILNWANFQIDKGETVKFNDKNNYLNLVHGVDISRIYGTLSGGNIVYLVNPNGILFGQGTKLDNVGSFVASTRNISAINKEAFLQDPSNTVAVLGTDNPVMDNKDYYPEDSPYVPKISVAEMQLTNVPESATKIILDGPGGVILKNTELLDQVTQVTTRKVGGEIGIGGDNGTVTLTENQKSKIALLNADKVYAYDESANLLQGYKTIKNMDELVLADYNNTTQRHFILINDIDASGMVNYKPIEGRGTLDGLGYSVSNLTINTKDEDLPYLANIGLYSTYEGNIRNISLKNIDYNLNAYILGGLVGQYLGGSVSNVYVDGKIRQGNAVGGIVGTGGWNTEIRNSVNKANISISAKDYLGANNVGGIMGEAVDSSLFGVSNFGSISSTKEAENDWSSNVGGILGFASGTSKVIIVGAYNGGEVYGKTTAVEKNWNPEYYDKITNGLYVGGIVGSVYGKEFQLGEVYCNSAVKIDYGYIDGWFGKGKIGGTIGVIRDGVTDDIIITSKVTGKNLPVAFVDERVGYPADTTRVTYVGTNVSPSVLSNYNSIKVMLGITNAKDIESSFSNGNVVVPPVNPEPDTPIVPPVNPEPDTPVVPPAEPQPDVPITPPVEPSPNMPQEPSVNDKEDALKDIIGEKEYKEIIANITNIDKDQVPYWKNKISSTDLGTIEVTMVGENAIKQFEMTEKDNATVVYNGRKYTSDFGEKSNEYYGSWNKESEVTLSKIEFDVLDGMIETEPPENDDIWGKNSKAASGALALWGMDFLSNAIDSIHLKVEMYKWGDKRKLVLKAKSGSSTTHMQVGQKIPLGGTQTADMMRYSNKIKKQYPELDQDKFYSGTGYISEAYFDNPYDYYIEIDKDLNASLKPIIPEGSSFIISSFPAGTMMDITSDLEDTEIPLSKDLTIKILDILEKAGFHFGEYSSLRENILPDIQNTSGGVPQSVSGVNISR